MNEQKDLKTSLSWQHFPAGEHGFYRAPVLVTGQHEAILIDGGFTFADGKALVESIKASGKTLTTIYVSQSDPDYYFSLTPIRTAFPAARVMAASATIAAIQASAPKKLATWGPQLKENGPQTMSEVVIPEAFDGSTLTLEGQSLEIVDAQDLPNRRYLWAPSLGAIWGGVLAFSGVHVWVADAATPELRAAWIRNLDTMAARSPKVVVAGHSTVDSKTDAESLAYTRNYLLAFEEEVSKAADSGTLIAAMKARYPGAGMEVALNIGAKVVLGEMKWG